MYKPCFINSIVVVNLMVFWVTNVSSVIDGSLKSLVRITVEVCRPEGHDEEFARQFYKCYSTVLTEKEKCIFQKCQNQIFGNLLDTKFHIEAACAKSQQNPDGYPNCLMREFQACQLDAVRALAAINRCQAPLLGLE